LLAPEPAALALRSSDVPGVVPNDSAVLAQAGAENFAVASRLLPRAVRAHLLAIYGFARLTDDIGDEAEGDRVAMLDWLESELDRAVRGQATHPVLQRLAGTISHFNLPLDPFRCLIAANRQDQIVHRYESFDDLVAYSTLSAAPVGQLVLLIFGVATPARMALSDDVCIGLQIVEHIQDVAEDAAADRIYLPQRDLRAFGCTEAELYEPQAGPRLRQVLRHEASRARRLLASAPPLARGLPLQPRIAICGFAAGGLAALDSVERAGYDVLGQACRPRPLRLAARLGGVLRASSTARAT
jgi:squalene synthase HpnC